MNNVDRSEWVNNDEYLYTWWKSARISLRKFIKENKQEIDNYINKILNREPE